MADFPQLDFEQFNEADVREEVIGPLLRELGYISGTKNNVRREMPLRYPQRSLGRKKPSTDPKLRGKADYILDADDRIRWVIEAKAPGNSLTNSDIEQAWSYASHVEVRAKYFALCNGHLIQVFQTDLSPDAGAILTIPYEELSERFVDLSNLLSPKSLLRNFPAPDIEIGRPIGPGLKSAVRITNGLFRYDSVKPDLPPLKDLQFTVVGGSVGRGEKERLTVFVSSLAPLRSLQEMNEKLGLAVFEMESDDTTLSADPENPTTFRYTRTIRIPAGSEVPNLSSWNKITLPINLAIETDVIAKGSLSDLKFFGHFKTTMRILELNVLVESEGPFEIHLA